VPETVPLAQAQTYGRGQADDTDQSADGKHPWTEAAKGCLGIFQAGYVVI